jgi:hypothetical protein
MKTFLVTSMLLVGAAFLAYSQQERAAVTDGFIQFGQSEFNESSIYLRNSSNWHREGYLTFEVSDALPVISALIRLYPYDLRNNPITMLDFTVGHGNLIEGMTWDTRPTGLEVLGTVPVTFDHVGTYVELDVTEYYNGLIADGSVQEFTIRMVSESVNAYAMFRSSASSETQSRPKLVVTTDCPSFDMVVDTFVCEGTNPVIDGVPRSESGTYTEHLSSICGSDSTVVYNLTVVEDKTTVENIHICEGESYKGFNETGIYYHTVEAEDGACSHVYEIHLTVHNNPVVDLGADIDIAEDESVMLNVETGFESYLWSDGSTGESLVVSSDYFSNGDEISLVVTDENNCSSTDKVNLIIRENAIKALKDGHVREYDDTYVGDFTGLEIKYDQYGDLDNPGNPPFWSREAYLTFDLQELEHGLKDFKLRLFLYNITWVSQTANEPIKVDVDMRDGAYSDDITWSSRPPFNHYESVGSVTLSEDDLDHFIEIDINDYILGAITRNADMVSLRLSTYTDENSSMVKFRSLEYGTDTHRPRIAYSRASTGIENPMQNRNFELYPNPVNDWLNINTTIEISEIIIRNLSGQTVKHLRHIQEGIDVSDLPKGVYVITIMGGEGQVSQKIVKL